MGLMKKFFNQTRKPEGTLGKMMLKGMNSGHAKLADWGFEHLPKLSPKMAAEITAALKAAGFTSVKSDHHTSKPWITVIAQKS